MADHLLAPVAQVHVMKAYLAVSFAAVIMAIGAYLKRFSNIGFIQSLVSCGVALIPCFLFDFLSSLDRRYFYPLRFRFDRETPHDLSCKCLAVFYLGISMNAGYAPRYGFDENFMIAVCLGVALPFICFAATARLTNHKVYFYTIALISSKLSTLIWLQLASYVFGGSTALFQYKLYFVLMLHAWRLRFTTPQIIGEAAAGVQHSYTREAQEIFIVVYLHFTVFGYFLLKKKLEEEK